MKTRAVPSVVVPSSPARRAGDLFEDRRFITIGHVVIWLAASITGWLFGAAIWVVVGRAVSALVAL